MKKIILLILLIIPFNTFALSASSYVVMDMDNNIVLKESNKDTSRLVASISKIMTAIVTIENININKEVTVDNEVLKSIGSSIYIEVGETIKIKDLLYGLLLRSGNDAAIILAKEVSGSMDNFAKLMNEYAKKIGMNNSFFINSNGLENDKGLGNKSSAYDMAILTSYAYENEMFRKIFSTKTYSCESDKKKYTWQNKNKLLKYDYITGGKTGYTIKAKRTLVTTAKINNMNIVVVTLNDPNDWTDHINLYKQINKDYKRIKVLDKNNFKIIDESIYIEDKLYIKNDYSLIIKKGGNNNYKIKYYLKKVNKYNNNEIIGYAKVLYNEKILYEQPIYITNKKSKLSFFKKIFK